MEMKCEQVAEMQAPYYNIKNAYPQNARFTAEESERAMSLKTICIRRC